MKQLTDNIEGLIAETDGKWSVVLEDLQTNDMWQTKEDETHYAASIIKLPIMATVYRLADEGKLRLSEMINLEKEDLVGGAGVLQHLTPAPISIADLVTLMIIQSDNTATNVLIDRVTVEQVQKTMAIVGMKKSTFYNKLMTVPVEIEGYNLITAGDISKLLRLIVTGKFSSLYACEQMIDVMKKQQIHYITEQFPAQSDGVIGAPAKWEFASKTGNVTGVHHDVGILYVGDRSMSVTILSSECDKNQAMNTLHEIGLAIYRHLVATA